ncbi:hypothetical protein LCM10_09515 [Rossellomorea aquimaris]|uniref:hypothetical protein n=1 Tax=Rossellomorea aquimaris TaxID=189382 RepID=UPI001CD333C6|nr:hypothetical protein [Rossellomorea aquimaris]MCA1055225.1 hypothetical protein [Rossellomorea aquimaris]
MRNNQEQREIQESLRELFKENPYSGRTKRRWLDELDKGSRVYTQKRPNLIPGILSIAVAMVFFTGFAFFLLQKWEEGRTHLQEPVVEAPTGVTELDEEKKLDKKVEELMSQEEVDIKDFLTYFYDEFTNGYKSYPMGSHDGYYYQSKEEVAEGVLSVLEKMRPENEKLKGDLDRLEVLLEEFLYTSRKFPPDYERPDPAKVYYYSVGLIADLHQVIVLGGEEDLNGFSLSGNGRHTDVIKAIADGSRVYPDPESPLILTEDQKDDFLPIEAFQIEKTEFTDLSTYVHSTYESYQDGSEYKEHFDNESAESSLIGASIAYINYFKEDIKEKGMTEEFEEWQKIAYEYQKSRLSVGEAESVRQEELKVQFERKMEEIVEEF